MWPEAGQPSQLTPLPGGLKSRDVAVVQPSESGAPGGMAAVADDGTLWSLDANGNSYRRVDGAPADVVKAEGDIASYVYPGRQVIVLMTRGGEAWQADIGLRGTAKPFRVPGLDQVADIVICAKFELAAALRKDGPRSPSPGKCCCRTRRVEQRRL